ncbi:cytochrome c oxidase assembly factor Coa1 family protein [Rheinheimera sp. WS51]|uniref:cytochrome c oxidase assembly factor Coa1 family protein n=1 Tax=Rheinheimera sp. WS51 TaxID=3425886 RepID=UPI003D8E90FC
MKGNFKWILIGLLAFCVMASFISGIVVLVMKMMKGEAYDISLQAVRDNPMVIEKIGKVIDPSWYVLGNVNINGPEGSATIEYSISGEVSAAKVYVYATRHAGEWTLYKLIVAPENDGNRIIVIDSENNS